MAGSEKRKQKPHSISALPSDMAQIDELADAAGYSRSAYMVAKSLDRKSPGPRATRKPPVQRQELARLLGQIGKLGGNVNQIARTLNTLLATDGDDDPYGLTDDIKAAAVEVAEMRAAVMKALGRVHE